MLTSNAQWYGLSKLTYAADINHTESLVGCARVISASPLGADLSRAVQSMEKKRPGIFGRSGASAQVFSLYTSASAAGVLVGPVWTSYAYGERNWTFLVSSLGILCASVAVPLVCYKSTFPAVMVIC